MTTATDFHNRNNHSAIVEMRNPNTWSQEERIAARQDCATCRIIFRADGEFRAAGNRPEALEFADRPATSQDFAVETGNLRNGDSFFTVRRTAPAPIRHTANVRLATDAQFKYIKDLIAERELTIGVEADVARARAGAVAKTLTSRDASALIDSLKALPVKAQPAPVAPVLPVVPDGRYALRTEDHVDFYQVESPTKGNWVGHTFVSVQASDDLHPLRNRTQKAGILARIAEDPKAASALYGQELGQCGVCGRTLTDDVSRARGIGPVCNEKF